MPSPPLEAYCGRAAPSSAPAACCGHVASVAALPCHGNRRVGRRLVGEAGVRRPATATTREQEGLPPRRRYRHWWRNKVSHLEWARWRKSVAVWQNTSSCSTHRDSGSPRRHTQGDLRIDDGDDASLSSSLFPGSAPAATLPLLSPRHRPPDLLSCVAGSRPI
uniref:Uncharacterized protein n=1 Tax=Oryza sativa subsp. japonica TaxID=39947 RepID=Q6ZA72_ORYSJ|nr:hypothetical protein [Oryza sativa Japonica Group]